MILLLSFFKMYGSLIPGYMIGDFKMNMILNFKKEKWTMILMHAIWVQKSKNCLYLFDDDNSLK